MVATRWKKCAKAKARAIKAAREEKAKDPGCLKPRIQEVQPVVRFFDHTIEGDSSVFLCEMEKTDPKLEEDVPALEEDVFKLEETVSELEKIAL